MSDPVTGQGTRMEKDIIDIKTSMAKMADAVQALLLTNAKQEQDHKYIHDHRDVLYGTKDYVGVISELQALKKWKDNVDKVIWLLLGPLLVPIGSGVVWLIVNQP